MTNARKIKCALGAAVFLLGLGLIAYEMVTGTRTYPAFSCLSVTTTSNSCLITIGLTNQSDSPMVYRIQSAQVKTNGAWVALNAFSFPPGRALTNLAAGASTTVVFAVPLATGETRIPVLWGFKYSADGSRWHELQEDAIAWLRMRDLRGRGALYTNYVTGITR